MRILATLLAAAIVFSAGAALQAHFDRDYY